MTEIKTDDLIPMTLEEAYSKNFLRVEDVRRVFLCCAGTAQGIMQCCTRMAKAANPHYYVVKGKILPNDLKRYMEGQV